MRRLLKKSAAFVLLPSICATLSACVPSASTYWRVTAPDAAYFHRSCSGGYGPRSITYYPYHGIFISVDLLETPGLRVFMTLHIPSGSAVEVDDPMMHVRGLSPEGPLEIVLKLRPTPHGGVGNLGPPSIYRSRDPYVSANNFGPLLGGEDHGTLIWYLYVTEGSIPQNVISGSLVLPPLTIDGQHYAAQILTFTQEKFVGVLPVNC
jgi:hypothetical protein